MLATLECGNDDITIWFSSSPSPAHRVSIEELPNCSLLFGPDDLFLGLSIGDQLQDLCPYELAKTAAANAGASVAAQFESTYDASCDMGYVYFDRRGPASVDHSVDCGAVILDVGKDGAASPSTCSSAGSVAFLPNSDAIRSRIC